MQRIQNDTSETRYGMGTVRHILGRAQTWDQVEPETLSPDQIETLGREIGLSPQAIRRAMSEVSGSTTPTGTKRRNRAPQLTVSQVARIPVPGIAYGILLTLLFSPISGSPFANVLVSYVVAVGILPLVGSFFFGCLTRDRRAAIPTGVLLGGFAFAGAHLGMMINNASFHYWINQSVLGIVASLIGCVLLAALGSHIGTKYLADK